MNILTEIKDKRGLTIGYKLNGQSITKEKIDWNTVDKIEFQQTTRDLELEQWKQGKK